MKDDMTANHVAWRRDDLLEAVQYSFSLLTLHPVALFCLGCSPDSDQAGSEHADSGLHAVSDMSQSRDTGCVTRVLSSEITRSAPGSKAAVCHLRRMALPELCSAATYQIHRVGPLVRQQAFVSDVRFIGGSHVLLS